MAEPLSYFKDFCKSLLNYFLFYQQQLEAFTLSLEKKTVQKK